MLSRTMYVSHSNSVGIFKSVQGADSEYGQMDLEEGKDVRMVFSSFAVSVMHTISAVKIQ